MKRHYADDGFEFDRLILLGGAHRGLTDVGEVLMTLDAVPDGDAEAMVSAVLSHRGERNSPHRTRCWLTPPR